MKYAILMDTTRCTGCERCVTACVATNGLDRLQADTDRSTEPEGLSANRWSTVLQIEPGRYARKSCMHCLEPSCVAACLVGGLTKSADGPVVYDPNKCIGCRYCMLACPFHIPRYEWSLTTPFIRKCSMCVERLRDGLLPACVDACYGKALEFGDRDTMLRKAHDRIAADSRYLQHVWGEKELGGTSMLYISDVNLASLGWPTQQFPAIPTLTEPLISKTPFIGLGVAATMLSVNWVIRRRMKLAAAEINTDGEDANSGTGEDANA